MTDTTTTLVRMSLEDILTGWRPGSHGDDWTWANEAEDLWTRDSARTQKLMSAIFDHGFGLADSKAPVKLGNDGRVWNGHHRIVIAQYLQEPYLMVEIVPPHEKEHDG